MKKLILILLAVMLLPACSSLTKALSPSSPNAPLVNAGIEYLTIKTVESAKVPRQAAADAREILTAVNTLLAANTSTLDQVDQAVRKLIQQKARAPEDAALFDAIRQAAYNDLAARLTGGPLVAMSDADRAALASVLSDIGNGLVLAGY